MTDIVVIPCWRRPEFLAATLMCVERARGADDYHYLFTVDRGADPLVHDVIASFRFPHRKISSRHNYLGSAFNVLEAYRDAILSTREDDDLIFLLEDDVFVADDYFEFHTEAHELDREAKIVCACRGPQILPEKPKLNQKLKPTKSVGRRTPQPDAVYRHVSYRAAGVSHKRSIMPDILEHAHRGYYGNQDDYCAMRLEDMGYPGSSSSHADLVHRLVRRNLWWTIYPIVPRAFHAGFYSPNRRRAVPVVGPWREAAEQLLIMSDQEMNRRADPDFRDIERCDLINVQKSALRLTIPIEI